MNPLISALGSVGYALDTPGALLRGALAGNIGSRASGQDLLSAYGLSDENDPWGAAKGFGAEMILDPLALAGPALGAYKGIQGATRGARALAHADDVNPIARAIGRFAGDESGAIAHPEALELLRRQDNPLGRFEALAQKSPAKLNIEPEYQRAVFGSSDDIQDVSAVYQPDALAWNLTMRGPDMTGPVRKAMDPHIMPNLNLDQWGDSSLMEQSIRKGVRRGEMAGPISADQTPIHELGHAFHDQILQGEWTGSGNPAKGTSAWDRQSRRNLRDFGDSWKEHHWPNYMPGVSIPTGALKQIQQHLGKYATTNPREFVAEAFANQMLRGEPLSPVLRSLYQDLRGPELNGLPPEFLRAWWNLPRL